MDIGKEVAKAIEQAVDSKIEKAMQGGPQTVLAKYQGKDSEGKEWVLLAGADSPTPVRRSSVECEPGDEVSVTVGNGMAVIDANISNPSAGQKSVKVAQETAERAVDYAGQASTAARNAQIAAGNAGDAAETAGKAAADAQRDAAEVHGLAESAQRDAASAASAATEASQSASEAITSANKANYALSDVERVVGTLNWIAEHGSYELTEDTSVVQGKVYYTRSGTDPDYVYTVVPEPEDAELSTYYELHLDESVQNFLAAHLWLDDYGLNLSVDSSNGWRIHQGTVDGTKAMGTYIIDPNGTVALTLSAAGETIGRAGESRMELDYHSLKLIDKEGNTYFHVSDLRDSSGYATIAEKFEGNGTKTSFKVNFPPRSVGTTTVDVSGSSSVAVTSINGQTVNLSSAPARGSTVTITYQTGSPDVKAYTFGMRMTNSRIGALSVVEGYMAAASGHYSHAEGLATEAAGVNSHAEGSHSKATGGGSHAEGSGTEAMDTAAHAEGASTKAVLAYSHAEGYGSNALGSASHAEGYGSDAFGTASHAEGYDTYASGAYSHAQNQGTMAASDSQTALGKYNIRDASDVYAVIIGNGTGDSARSNAMAIRKNGLVDIGGTADIYGESNNDYETAYPTFIKSSWSTASDESTLPVTPCFVLDTSDMGLYWCDGQ